MKRVVALLGNPNVGKSTVFNEITGSHQHTGNWSGKTVDIATGEYYYKFNNYNIIDLPGTYSLLSCSEEERIARDFVCFNRYDCVVCVVDSTMLARNLNLVYQVLEVTDKVVVLLNLADEAKKKNITINIEQLSQTLGVPVVQATARSGRGINNLLEQVHLIVTGAKKNQPKQVVYISPIEQAVRQVSKGLQSVIDTDISRRFLSLRLLENDQGFNNSFSCAFGSNILDDYYLTQALIKGENTLSRFNLKNENYIQSLTESLLQKSTATAVVVVQKLPSRKEKYDAFFDQVLLGKYTAIPSMLLLFGFVLWITIAGSNYPSELLKNWFDSIEAWLGTALLEAGVNETFISLTVYGILRVLFWVVAVMLPPMAIFFPLFALLEDFGALPRFAFNLDRCFECADACGKQVLTTCMGYGCNAVGVTGARIIESPRERIIAIVTNSLSPCNGRFPPPTLWQLLWMKVAKTSSK